MTTPSTQISISDIQTELGITGGTALTLNDTNVRRLAGKTSGAIGLLDLRGKGWLFNLAGVQSSAGCYSAQGGFSVDRLSDGNVYLTMGAWPNDPPNCGTCSWEWLMNGSIGNTTSYNSYRISNTSRYWTKVWKVNITAMSVGQTYETRPDFNDSYGTAIYGSVWPYSNVSYTYRITKTANNSISIVVYPNSWGTGDTGTSISVGNWWNNVVTLGGGDPNSGTLGSINLSWTDIYLGGNINLNKVKITSNGNSIFAPNINVSNTAIIASLQANAITAANTIQANVSISTSSPSNDVGNAV